MHCAVVLFVSASIFHLRMEILSLFFLVHLSVEVSVSGLIGPKNTKVCTLFDLFEYNVHFSFVKLKAHKCVWVERG